jgi:adenylosuccinate synthase
MSQGTQELAEFTTVTGKLRRVASFDAEIPNRAIRVNQPSHIVLNHVDHFDARCLALGEVTDRARREVNAIAASLDSPITHIGVGPAHLQMA